MIQIQEPIYLIHSMDYQLVSFRVNKVKIRFRTNEPNGVLLYSRDGLTTLLIELYFGSILVKASFGSGK